MYNRRYAQAKLWGTLFGLAVIVLILLTSCSAYQTATPTATEQGNTNATLVPAVPLVELRGNVYVRDDRGDVQGWLEAGTTVPALCSGDWCRIRGGQFDGLRFWRGCSDDNPARAGCTKAR